MYLTFEMAKGRRARPAAVSAAPASQKILAFDALDETKGENKTAGKGGSSSRRLRREYTERELLGSHTDITSDVPVWEEDAEARNRRWATVLFLAPIPILFAAIVTVRLAWCTAVHVAGCRLGNNDLQVVAPFTPHT